MGPKKDITNSNPFPGIRPFASEDHNLFFGRDIESNEVIMKLLKNRYITVIGDKGTGKSSLIFGGVLPKIVTPETDGAPGWKVISFTPGNDPYGNLSAALSDAIAADGQKSIGKDLIQVRLSENTGSLSEVTRKFLVKQNNNIVLVIDHFEELFRYSSVGKSENNPSVSRKFVDLIVKSASATVDNIYLVIIIRSEYLGDCSHFKGFTMFINNSNYLVPAIGAESLREVIEGPVKIKEANIEEGLVDRIINDYNRRSEQLPVLQHALMRMWSNWQSHNQPHRPISNLDYDLTGTIDNSILVHANEIYDDLNQQNKDICASVFTSVSSKGTDNKGVREPSDFETVKSVAGCTDKELTYLLDKFRNSSVSFLKPLEGQALRPESVIDIQNECLLQKWDRLKVWIDAEAASKDIYLRLSEASALYQQGKAGLYRPPELLTAIEWRNKNKPTLGWAVRYNPAFERAMVYLRTSENAYLIEEKNKIIQQKRKSRRTWLTTRILGITLFMALGFWFYTYIQKSSAERKTFIAETQRIQAVKGKAVADSFAIVVFKDKVASDSTTAVALEDARKAKEAVAVADEKINVSEKNTASALYQKKLAIEQRDEAHHLRMISVAKTMSLRSLQMSGEKELQALLAYQAYKFNKANKGYRNDPDIYAGLYDVFRKSGSGIRAWATNDNGIRSIAFIPGSKEFFTSGDDGKVIKWSSEKDDQLKVIYAGNDVIQVMAVSPDAEWLACGSSDASIKMIPLRGNNSSYEMTGHTKGVKSLIFSYDGKYLYSAALDGKVLKWDMTARTSVNVSTGSVEITSIDISSHGDYIAGLGSDGKVLVWNPDKKTTEYKIETSGKNIKVIRFDPFNNTLAIGENDGTVEMWDVDTHKKISEIKAHTGEITDIEFNKTVEQMATAGNDKKIKIYDVRHMEGLSEPPLTLADNENPVLVMQFSPDGQMIISGETAGKRNLICRPANADYMASGMCRLISRNMTQEEWNNYVAKDIPLEKTCTEKDINIRIEPIKSSAR